MAALISWSSMIGLRRGGHSSMSAVGVDAASESNYSRATAHTSVTATSAAAAAQSTSRRTSESGLAGPQSDVDEENDDNQPMTSLMMACHDEQLGLVKKLVRRGNTQLKAVDGRGRTALHHTIDNRSTKVCAALLNADLSLLDIEDSDGNTALLLAVIAGNGVIVKFLLKLGADVRTRDNQQRTVVHWASQCGHWDLIDVLSSCGAHLSDTDCHGASPLHYVAQMCGAATDDEGQYHATSLRVLDRLVANGAQVDCIDQDLRTPLFWAAGSGSPEACQALLKASANVKAQDKDGLTALHVAAARGHQACIDALVRHGAEVGSTDYSGCIPLMYSVSLGHVGGTRTLLARNSDPNHRDDRGRSPVHWAATKGSVECLKLLRGQGGDLWTKNDLGDYPIHEAALAQQNDAVRYLATSGSRHHSADRSRCGVNVPGVDGRTCLHIAAMTNNIPLVTFLVDNDADKEATMTCQDKPLTAYDASMLKHHYECAEFLRLCGVKSANPDIYYHDDDDDDDDVEDNESTMLQRQQSTKATDDEDCVEFVSSAPPLQHVLRNGAVLTGVSQYADDGDYGMEDGSSGSATAQSQFTDRRSIKSHGGTSTQEEHTGESEDVRLAESSSDCCDVTTEVEVTDEDKVVNGSLLGRTQDGDVEDFGDGADGLEAGGAQQTEQLAPSGDDRGTSHREELAEQRHNDSDSLTTASVAVGSTNEPHQRSGLDEGRSDTAVQTGEPPIDGGDTWRRRTNDKYVQTEQPFGSLTLTDRTIDGSVCDDVVIERRTDVDGDESDTGVVRNATTEGASHSALSRAAEVETMAMSISMSRDGTTTSTSSRNDRDKCDNGFRVADGIGVNGYMDDTGPDEGSGLERPGRGAIGDGHVGQSVGSTTQGQVDGRARGGEALGDVDNTVGRYKDASTTTTMMTDLTIRSTSVGFMNKTDAVEDDRDEGNDIGGTARTVERRSRIIRWRKKCDLVSRSVQTTLSSFPQVIDNDNSKTVSSGGSAAGNDDDCVFIDIENETKTGSRIEGSRGDGERGGHSSRSRTRMKHQHWDKQLEYIMFYSASDDDCDDDDLDGRSRRRRHRPHSVGPGGRGPVASGIASQIPLPRPFGSPYFRRSHSVVAPRREMRCRLRAFRRSLPGVAISSWDGWTYATAMRRELERAEQLRRRRRRERRRRTHSSATDDDYHGASRFLDYGYTKREREQMRIYGVRREGTAAELVLIANRMQLKSASKIDSAAAAAGEGAEARPDSMCEDRQTITRWLISGKNLIQEYVRIFETRRLVTIVLQRARKVRMRCRNSSRAVEATYTRQLVAEYNKMVKTESRVDESDFESINDFRRLLVDELLRVSEEEKYLKRIEKLLHLLPVDELDASITDYYSRASPRSASLASPSAVSATGSGILPRQTNSNEVGPSSLKNADGLSMAWLKNALAVDDGTTRRWGRGYHSNYHHHHHQPQQPHQPINDGNNSVGINWLRPMYVPESVKGSVHQSRAPHLQSSFTLPRVATGRKTTAAGQHRRCHEVRSAGPHRSPGGATVKTLPPISVYGVSNVTTAHNANKFVGDRSTQLLANKTKTLISQLGSCNNQGNAPLRLPVLQLQPASSTTTSVDERPQPHHKYGNSTMPSRNMAKLSPGAAAL